MLRRVELLRGREAMERTEAHYEERLRIMAERPSEPSVDEARYQQQLEAMRGAMMALEEELDRLRAEREILGVDFCQTQTLLMETQDALARECARADQFVMELACGERGDGGAAGMRAARGDHCIFFLYHFHIFLYTP